MSNKIPDIENHLSSSSREMKIHSMLDNIDWGARTKLSTRKLTTKSSKDGKVYGSKAIITKEGTRPTLREFMLKESDEMTMLPDRVVAEIKKNISAGAKDLEQNWKNALELVHKAYQVSNVGRPTPDQKGAWKQYEDMIQHGVRQLSSNRGLAGAWRSSQALVSEAGPVDKGIDASGGRFFVEVPGQSAVEVEGANLDEIIEAIQNKILRSRDVTGTRIRVEERTKTHAILTVWVHGVKRERIVIRQI